MQTENRIQVAALTGGLNHAATRFRVRQYIEPLRTRGIEVTEYVPYWGESCGLPSPFKLAARVPGVIRSRRADLVWISRDLVQGYGTFERCLKQPRILDVDDAIWLNWPLGRYCQPWVARGMDAVIAGNEYLADYYRQYCKTVYVVPTSIDVRRFVPREPDVPASDRFVIGWTGMRSNYRFLDGIEPALKRFMEAHDDAELMLVADEPWKPVLIDSRRIRYCPWTPRDEARLLQEMTVGLMPLPDNEWTRGKCSFKMLQYMACGLPVVVSPVGMNRQVLEKGAVGLAAQTEGEWLEALETLYKDRDLGRRMGREGRRVVETHYSAEAAADRLAEIFRYRAP